VIVSVRVLTVIVVVRVVMVRVIVAVDDGGGRAVLVQTELCCRYACSQDAFGRDLEIVDGKAAQRTAQRVERQPGVEEGAENHVAGGAVETVEIKDPHRARTGLSRKPETFILA
jgi:hypothetical protein